jgi:AraC-like DNA-binding protein
MARPHKVINEQQFENLCAIQCTEAEICDVLGVTDKTLAAWCKRTYKMSFSEIFRIKRSKGKASLRRLQYKEAEKGNVTMLIWLGKQWLDQAEKPLKTDTSDNEISDEVEELLKELEME